MKQTCFLILVFLALSCSSPDKGIFTIDPEKLKGDIITMSDIADDISYIPLDNKYPFGEAYIHRIVNGSIYLSAKDVGILVFNSDGKGVRRIGAIGNGPGEYQYSLTFSVDERTGNIHVVDKNKVKTYSQSGRFLRDFSYGDYINSKWAAKSELFNSFIFLPDYLILGTSKNSWTFLDTLGNAVSEKKNSVPQFKSNVGTSCPIYTFGGKLFYFNDYNDTVFCISPDLSYKAAYLFSRGNYRWPKNNIAISEVVSFTYKLFTIDEMFETNRFIVLNYAYNSGTAICFIEKKTKVNYLAYKNNVLSEGKREKVHNLRNDLDGGIPLTRFFNYYSSNGDEYITTLINPSDLKAYVSGDEFKSAVPKYPEKKAELLKLANSLSETDNPVLMMIRLKK